MGPYIYVPVDRETHIRHLEGNTNPTIEVGRATAIAFEGHGMAEDQVAAIDGLVDALTALRDRVATDGEVRYLELEAYHDAAHDDDCPCLVAAARAYLVPIVGEPLPDEPPAAAPVPAL